MILSHKIQLKVKPSQVNKLISACGVARYTYNWALGMCKAYYEEFGKSLNLNELKKVWNQIKPEWVYESPKDANQQPFTDLKNAFTKFFKKQAKHPKFKKRGARDSFYLSNDKLVINDQNYVKIPRIGWFKLTEKLRFTGKIMSATISREADRWFISIAVELNPEPEPKSGEATIGIDLGINTAVVCSTGETFKAPKPLKRSLRKLKVLQRRLSKKQKGSNNRAKARTKVAKLHRKIRNIRQDFLHKTTSFIISKAKKIIIEGLNVSGMLKNHCLARAIADIGFYEFRRQLEYKCLLNKVKLIIADQWFPSSQLCSCCGHQQKMSLNKRTYECLSCGMSLDRDLNAALNLCTLG